VMEEEDKSYLISLFNLKTSYRLGYYKQIWFIFYL